MKKGQSISVECVCPTCGCKHRRKMNWTGRGTPKIFCGPEGRCVCPPKTAKYNDDVELEHSLSPSGGDYGLL